MLKNILLATSLVALLMGCCAIDKSNSYNSSSMQKTQMSEFIDQNGKIYTVNTTDNYETAKFTDPNGKILTLKRERSANGIRLVNGDTEVFFTSKDAFISIDGKEITVTMKK